MKHWSFAQYSNCAIWNLKHSTCLFYSCNNSDDFQRVGTPGAKQIQSVKSPGSVGYQVCLWLAGDLYLCSGNHPHFPPCQLCAGGCVPTRLFAESPFTGTVQSCAGCFTQAAWRMGFPPRAAGATHSFPSRTNAIIRGCSPANGPRHPLRRADSAHTRSCVGSSTPGHAHTCSGSHLFTRNSFHILPRGPWSFLHQKTPSRAIWLIGYFVRWHPVLSTHRAQEMKKRGGSQGKNPTRPICFVGFVL